MRTIVLVVFTIAIGGLAPRVALAQPAGIVARDNTLSSLRRDAFIRLSIYGRHTVGQFSRVTNDSLHLIATTVPIAALDSVWVRGNAVRQGAIYGSVVGGTVFMLLGAIAARDVCSLGFDVCFLLGPEIVVTHGVIGAGAGLLLGAGLGYLAHYWRRVHP